ncbi:retrovirus-related pol polyprotein from transposon TNT 1-94 [Tanacetum coccineum]
MEDDVDQFSLAKKSFEFKKRQILINNDRLLEENIASDIMCTYLHSLNEVDNCGKCKSLDVVLLDLQESNNSLSELKKRFAKLEEYNITLDIAFQNHKEQMILNDHDTKNKQLLVKTINNQSVEINDLKVQLQDKLHNEKWAPATSHRKNNKYYVDASRMKQTIETITKEHAVKQNARKTDNTMLPSTGRVSSTNASRSKPKINTKNDRISQPSSRSMMNKVEAHHRKFKSSANKKNHVSDCNANVKNVTLSKNSDTICLSYNKCLFSANHDACVVKYLKKMQKCKVAKSAKQKVKSEWKLTGRIFQIVGLKWVPTGRMFILVESKCSSSPSRNTATKILHNRQIPTTTAIPVNEPYLEVAFRKHTCFVRNLEGVDLLLGSRGSNLYTISMADMMMSSLICLLSKASKTKSWLWHCRLSHLNFSTINKLAKQGLVNGLPTLKYTNDHLCSACQMGKSKKESHPHKPEPSTNEKLQMLHMDLYRPMRVESLNKKRYILVIVDDYSRFTWVMFFRMKDKAPEIIIKILKQAQVNLNATVRYLHTDNSTEFLNQTLRNYMEEVRITHNTSTAPIATTCYTQNRSLIHTRYDKTLYELLRNRKPELKYLHVFYALCYPTNDFEDLGKLQPKVDIRIFIGYSPSKKAYWIYNKRTRQIMETMNVQFDELTQMASEQHGSGPDLHGLISGQINSGLLLNQVASTSAKLPT